MPSKFKKLKLFNWLIVKNMSLEGIFYWNKTFAHKQTQENKIWNKWNKVVKEGTSSCKLSW